MVNKAPVAVLDGQTFLPWTQSEEPIGRSPMRTVLNDSELSAQRLKQAFAYWCGKLAGRAMPARRDIDPVDMPKLLPYVMLVDVLAAPLDFRYRLIGTEVRGIIKHDYTGKRFSEIRGKGKDATVWDNCEQVVLTKAPFSRSPPYIGPEKHLRCCENLLLPLSENGLDVSTILQVISVERGPA
jgi:hypothetical protein